MMSNSVFNKLSVSLPDDRPITGVQVIECLDKCPYGFNAIVKTYDQDQDADLGLDSSFLKRKTARYLCLSKTQGLPGYIISRIIIVNEKLPPEGFCILNRTIDTEQRVWRKKQLCYQLVPRKTANLAVTDIIICSRLKKAPEGFILAGEINGVIICYKMGNVQDTESASQNNLPPDRPPKSNSLPTTSPVYPTMDSDGDYEILDPTYNNKIIRQPPVPAAVPVRPAPLTPGQSTHTLLSNSGGLDGVPFIINPRFANNTSDKLQIPIIRARSMQQLMKDYDYSFSVERQ